MSRASAVFFFLLTAVAATALPSAARAGSGCGWFQPWSCCDQWGYDWPGFWFDADNCKDDGGTIECSNFCSNQSILPFSCCNADGTSTDGVYGDRHSCMVAGKAVFESALCPAVSSCIIFSCCDQWGYDWPGLQWTKDGCEDGGGSVECGVNWCENQSLSPFKCCDEEGYPVPDVSGTRHGCKMGGGTVWEDANPYCPNTWDVKFSCCDPAGGDASGVFTYRSWCREAGYIVQEAGGQCPGEVTIVEQLQDIKEDVKDMLDGLECAQDKQAFYKPLCETYGIALNNALNAEADLSGEPPEPGALWSDKDLHCSMSCYLTMECGLDAAVLAGWLKETSDLFDDDFGNAWLSGDNCANQFGQDIGVELLANGGDPLTCTDYCSALPNLEETCDSFWIAGYPISEPGTQPSVPFKGALMGLSAGLQANQGGASVAANGLAIETYGAELVALAATIAIGDIGTIGEVDVRKTDVDAFTLQARLEDAQQGEVFASFEGGSLRWVMLNYGTGDQVVVTVGGTVDVPCTNPGQPCGRRLEWLEWDTARFPGIGAE